MHSRSWIQLLNDLIDAIERIVSYTDGMTPEAFAEDQKTIDAVVRNLTVIGEAANRIPQNVIEENPFIPWSQMRGLRNLIVHEYFRIDPAILWVTIQNDLIPLQTLLWDMQTDSID